ncbi:hypothetical protein IE53DRAFT_383815 [Violaceomyces palustris]|uniref:Uncharacterized protein n=1 Tax=Violaceomyces palustris TaxID=1673888 RepID=A0ACD0P6M9_9BASI|nr:hypothetical protein IE53DRAFT_383815 [Violaceomyces palustris]
MPPAKLLKNLRIRTTSLLDSITGGLSTEETNIYDRRNPICPGCWSRFEDRMALDFHLNLNPEHSDYFDTKERDTSRTKQGSAGRDGNEAGKAAILSRSAIVAPPSPEQLVSFSDHAPPTPQSPTVKAEIEERVRVFRRQKGLLPGQKATKGRTPLKPSGKDTEPVLTAEEEKEPKGAHPDLPGLLDVITSPPIHLWQPFENLPRSDDEEDDRSVDAHLQDLVKSAERLQIGATVRAPEEEPIKSSRSNFRAHPRRRAASDFEMLSSGSSVGVGHMEAAQGSNLTGATSRPRRLRTGSEGDALSATARDSPCFDGGIGSQAPSNPWSEPDFPEQNPFEEEVRSFSEAFSRPSPGASLSSRRIRRTDTNPFLNFVRSDSTPLAGSFQGTNGLAVDEDLGRISPPLSHSDSFPSSPTSPTPQTPMTLMPAQESIVEGKAAKYGDSMRLKGYRSTFDDELFVQTFQAKDALGKRSGGDSVFGVSRGAGDYSWI